MQIDIAQNRLAAALPIREGHMLKVNGAVPDVLDGVFRTGDVRLLLQHFLNALSRRRGLRDHD